MKDAVYQVITDRLIALLEQGTVPWHKPWRGGDTLPQNLVSRQPYRGVNVFMLHAMSYESPFWLTFKQAKEMGGNVRKGEHACPVVFWKWLDVAEASEPTGKRSVPMLRYYSVFNVAQCDGVTAPAVEGTDRAHNPIETAEQIVAAMPKRPAIRHGFDRAFYSPAADSVGMPSPERFEKPENYYNVLFHELTHALSLCDARISPAVGPQSGVSRGGKGGFPHCQRADYVKITLGYFVVTFFASFRESRQETAKAGKRTSRVGGEAPKCLQTLAKNAFRPWL